jgi:DNA-binding beta-propeller fold protein YncE
MQITKIDKIDNFASQRSWAIDSNPNGLSVCNRSRNVLVTCLGGGGPGTRNRLREFTTHGSLVREIILPIDVVNPCHAIQLTPVQFMASHGLPGDPTNRICVIDKDGIVFRSFSGKGPKQLLQNPTDLAIDESKKFVFVCDSKNNRVLIADVTLTKSRELPLSLGSEGHGERSFEEGLNQPRAICLDEQHGRLYIGEAGEGRILVIGNVFRNLGEEFLCCD